MYIEADLPLKQAPTRDIMYYCTVLYIVEIDIQFNKDRQARIIWGKKTCGEKKKSSSLIVMYIQYV